MVHIYHQEQSRVQCLDQGHFNMQTAGAGSWTTGRWTGQQPHILNHHMVHQKKVKENLQGQQWPVDITFLFSVSFCNMISCFSHSISSSPREIKFVSNKLFTQSCGCMMKAKEKSPHKQSFFRLKSDRCAWLISLQCLHWAPKMNLMGEFEICLITGIQSLEKGV